VVWQAAAWCLNYPDEPFVEALGTIARALHEQPPTDAVERLLGFVDGTRGRVLSALQEEYVAVFDLSRKHALYLSYWTDGDTRRRGEVLATFKQRYRASGYLVDTHGELPDYLPMVLEFAATVDPDGGRELLQAYRPSIELLRIALREMESPYALVVEAVCGTLPGASPRDRAEVMRMAGLGPPSESVGLQGVGLQGVGLQGVGRA
jgi:nitrate reductase molybdenum cofactor assembly chaperone NarJ/NarW